MMLRYLSLSQAPFLRSKPPTSQLLGGLGSGVTPLCDGSRPNMGQSAPDALADSQGASRLRYAMATASTQRCMNRPPAETCDSALLVPDDRTSIIARARGGSPYKETIIVTGGSACR